MAEVARAALRARVREIVGIEATGDGAITDATLNRFIEDSVSAFHAMCVEHLGADFFTTSHSFNTVAAQTRYTLPTDFWIMQAVLYRPPNEDDFCLMRQWQPRQLADLVNDDSNTIHYYRLTGTQGTTGALPLQEIMIQPVPVSIFPIQLLYTPQTTHIVKTSDSDVHYDGVNGWEGWVVYDCAAKCRAIEETDPSFELAQRAQWEGHIRALAGARDMHEPERVRIVETPYDADIEDMSWMPRSVP